MITVPELAAEFLANYMRRRFGSSQAPLVEMVPSIARIAIECIGNSDALYHNVEHTMLVTLAGHDILRGRALHTHMPAEDYARVIIACLTHDIGYVRGVFREDDQDGYLVDTGGRDNDMFEKIVARHDGRTTAMDGPFTEAKEVVGGYALMDVRDEAEAIELTERFLGIIGTGTCHLHEVGPAPF